MANINIGGRLHSTATGNVVAGTNEILDDNKNKKQSIINQEVDETLANHNSRINALSEQNYITVEATAETTDVATLINSTEHGEEVNTIYRVSTWDGSQYVTDAYCEYAYDEITSSYKLLHKLNYGIDNTPTNDSNNLVKSDGIFREFKQIKDSIYGIQNSLTINDNTSTSVFSQLNILLGEEFYIKCKFASPITRLIVYYNTSYSSNRLVDDNSGNSEYIFKFTAPANITSILFYIRTSTSTLATCKLCSHNPIFDSVSQEIKISSLSEFLSAKLIKTENLINTFDLKQIDLTIDGKNSLIYPEDSLSSLIIDDVYCLISNNSYNISNLIEVVPEQNYICNVIIRVRQYYDSNFNPISQNTTELAAETVFSVPSNAKYMRCVIKKNYWNGNIILNKGTSLIEYKKPFNLSKSVNVSIDTEDIVNSSVTTTKIADSSVTDSKIADSTITAKKLKNEILVDREQGKNIYDKNSMYIDGKGVEVNTGTISNYSDRAITDFIPVEAGVTYFFRASTWCRVYLPIAWYDSNKSCLQSLDKYYFGFHTAPENAAYLVCYVKYGGDYTQDFAIIKTSKQVVYKSYNAPKALLDKSVYYDSLNNEINVFMRSYNLYDPNSMYIPRLVIDNNGNLVEYNLGGSAMIPVEPNTTYYFSATLWTRNKNFAWYDSSLNKLAYDITTPYQGAHTSPNNAAYLFLIVRYTNGFSENVMVTKSSVEMPYVPYYQIDPTRINNLDERIESIIEAGSRASKILKIKKTISGDNSYYKISEGNDYINAIYPNSSQNNNFNFTSIYKNGKSYWAGDDIPAMHIFNTTLGGNHGQPINKVTIENHGFTNADIGTAWVYTGNGTSNGKIFYIAAIYDTNTIALWSENSGTYNSPSWYYLPNSTGTITKDGVTKTITSNANGQLYPFQQNINIKFFIDNKEVDLVTAENNTEFFGDVIDVVQSCEIPNPVSVQSNLISNVGNTNPPTYEGTSAIRWEETFRFVKGLNIIFMTRYIVLEQLAFSDFLYGMKKPFGTLSQIKYYIPNSLPLSTDGGNTFTFDCRTPSVFPTGTSSIIWVDDTRKANQQYPINRVLQIDTDNSNIGVAMGIFTEDGVGKNLDSYTNHYFELRYGAGNVYPNPTNSTKVGNTLQPGQIYSAIMYWGFFEANLTGDNNRMCMYHFNINNTEYVYIDYKGTMLDKVEIDNSLNGKTVEVIESANTSLVDMIGDNIPYLKNSTYNGGFYVNANYVNDETCYIVCKIK